MLGGSLSRLGCLLVFQEASFISGGLLCFALQVFVVMVAGRGTYPQAPEAAQGLSEPMGGRTAVEYCARIMGGGSAALHTSMYGKVAFFFFAGGGEGHDISCAASVADHPGPPNKTKKRRIKGVALFSPQHLKPVAWLTPELIAVSGSV